MSTDTIKLGLIGHPGCPLSSCGGEQCDFSHWLVDYPALTDERLPLLKLINSYDINYPSFDILNSNNIAIIRAIKRFILRIVLRIWTLRHVINVLYINNLLFFFTVWYLCSVEIVYSSLVILCLSFIFSVILSCVWFNV